MVEKYQPWLLAVAGAGVILFFLYGRFDLVPAGGTADQNVVYKLDRLTGEVSLCAPNICRPIAR